MIRKHPKLCLDCVDKNHNHCSRVINQMLEDNKIYKMKLCGDIKDGNWTKWETVEKCIGVKNIGKSNYTCGLSRTLQRMNCSRSLGGKYCREQKTGAAVLNDVMVRTVPCQDVDCPGNTVLFMITSHS